MNAQERGQFIDAMLDGEISEADFLRIEAELSVDPEARQEYYHRLGLSVLLEAVAAESLSTPRIARRLNLQAIWTSWKLIALAICSIAFAVSLWLLRSDGPSSEIARMEPSPQEGLETQASGFGVISGQSNAVWRDAEVLADGSLLPTGTLNLMSGLVQLELFSGVTVVVEGAAEFSVLSSMEMSVATGKVRAHVPPPATGFRIHTRDGDIVDLGTEFAIDASSSHTDVHVLDGEVEWHDGAQGFQRLEKGEGYRRSGKLAPQQISSAVGQFVSDADFRNQIAVDRKHRREQWLKSSLIRTDDNRLLAWYRTGAGDPSSRRMKNGAEGRKLIASEAAIVAAGRSSDRWGFPEAAVDFSPTGSRMRMVVPGEHSSLTLLCWVRINSLDRWYNSLFLTDGHDLHEPHWQIMDDGRLFFSVKKRDRWDTSKGEKDKHIFYSPPFWNASLSGKWLMLATVYDVDAAKVTHYLNGEQLSQESVPPEYLVENVRIGNASLGNWGMPERDDPHFAVRNLNGSLDEFALFGAALSAEEIGKLYEDGKQ